MAQPSNVVLNSFKTEVLRALHDFTASTGHVFKLVLYKAAAAIGTHGASDTGYASVGADEHASGTGYTSGGVALTSVTPALSGSEACCDFADLTLSSATLTTSGAMIINSSASNKGVSNHNYGGDQTIVAGTFTTVFPAAAASTAIIRIA